MMGSDIQGLINRAMERTCDCGHLGSEHMWGGTCKVYSIEVCADCGCDNYAMPGNLPALIRQLELEEKEPPLVSHELKILPQFFEDVVSGRKTFELRRADRFFAIGDLLRLREYRPGMDKYTGREHTMRVVYVMTQENSPLFGLEPGYCILGIAPPDLPFKDGGRTRFPERGDFKDRVEHHHPEGISRKSIDPRDLVTVEDLPREWVLDTAALNLSGESGAYPHATDLMDKVIVTCRRALREHGFTPSLDT